MANVEMIVRLNMANVSRRWKIVVNACQWPGNPIGWKAEIAVSNKRFEHTCRRAFVLVASAAEP